MEFRNGRRDYKFWEKLIFEFCKSKISVFSANDNYLAVGCNDGTIKIWDFHTSKKNELVAGVDSAHKDWIRSVSFSPKSNIFASGRDNKIIKIWEI